MGCDRSHQYCVTIRRGLGRQVGTDIAAGAGTIVDDDLLSQARSHFLAHGPCKQIGGAARGVGHDDADCLCGIVLGQQRLHACSDERADGEPGIRDSHDHS